MAVDPINMPQEKPPRFRFIFRETMGVFMLGLVLFLAAGTISWGMGWLMVGIVSFWAYGTALILITKNPGLIRERLGPKKGGKAWDAGLMAAIGFLIIGRLVLAGLDHRYGWTGVPVLLMGLAVLMSVLAHALILWATWVNAFFSQIVRIQEDKGHKVVSTGPYQFVRHPAYLGTVLFEISAPLMLGSFWALIPGIMAAILFVVRAYLEDNTLAQELPGYAQYSKEVRYRLLPNIW